MLNPVILSTIHTIAEKQVNFSPERAQQVDRLIHYLTMCYKNGLAQTNTICTHNSRRSHIGQFWCKVLSIYFQLPATNAYSGGTEVTACHPNTIAALQRIGAQIERLDDGKNPKYNLFYNEYEEPISLFSKRYDDPSNAPSNFVAIMVCSEADSNCPFVAGASIRVALPFQDPKHADGTELVAQAYDATVMEIGTTFYKVFQKVAMQPNK